MNIEQIKTLLHGVFVPRTPPLEGVCFASDYMIEANIDKYEIYKAISNVMHNSGLTFNFSYEVAQKAVDIIIACIEDGKSENEDFVSEQIDNAIPVYNNELMIIYANDYSIVDSAVEELGAGDSIENAKAGWYVAIRGMVEEIRMKIEEISDWKTEAVTHND